MTQFVISYIGGDKPATPEAGMAHMAKYKAWIAGLGESAVSPANPFVNTHTISPDGSVSKGSSTSMSGYTIIDVETIEQAIEAAKGCPFLDVGGSLEVSQLMQMPG
ncbi:MAG: YciI family protein [Psychrosphaera sp.]|nr:YciI family protein [Psychrosphaera sp.]